MYYTGTQEQLEAYLSEVNTGENYSGGTTKWAEVIKHHTQNKYAIVAHPNYPSQLATINSLPSDWFPQLDN